MCSWEYARLRKNFTLKNTCFIVELCPSEYDLFSRFGSKKNEVDTNYPTRGHQNILKRKSCCYTNNSNLIHLCFNFLRHIPAAKLLLLLNENTRGPKMWLNWIKDMPDQPEKCLPATGATISVVSLKTQSTKRDAQKRTRTHSYSHGYKEIRSYRADINKR